MAIEDPMIVLARAFDRVNENVSYQDQISDVEAAEVRASSEAALRSVEGKVPEAELARVRALIELDRVQRSSSKLFSQMEAALEVGDEDAFAALSQKQFEEMAAIAPPGAFEPDDIPASHALLFEAIEVGDLDAIDHILATSKVDLNAPQGRYGATALSKALHAEGRSARVIGCLLAAGADATQASEEGYTPLHLVADYTFRSFDAEGTAEIVRALVEAGRDLEARQHWGWTPLMRAICEGDAVEASALLAAGADPNTRNEGPRSGYCQARDTALLAALAEPEKVSLLLRHGADPSLVDAEGTGPLERARDQHSQAVRRLAEREAEGRPVNAFDRSYPESLAESVSLLEAAARTR